MSDDRHRIPYFLAVKVRTTYIILLCRIVRGSVDRNVNAGWTGKAEWAARYFIESIRLGELCFSMKSHDPFGRSSINSDR